MTASDNTKTHTDINSNGWLMAHVPPAARPYALLARLDRPAGIWLLLLPGWWSIVLAAGGLFSLNHHDIEKIFLFGIGAVVMRAAGCVINDLWDYRFDRQVARTKARPLASGAVNFRQAVVFLAALLVAGLVILFDTKSLVTIMLGFLVLPLIVIYPLMKRITWWPQLFLGLVFNFGALMGWSAVTGVVQLPAVLLYFAGIFWTLGYDTIYAHQDREDDARIGVRSAALKLGAASRTAVAAFYLLSWLLLAAAFYTAASGWLSFLLLLLPAIHLFRQAMSWNMNDPESCLRIFRSNRDCGLLILLAAAL